MQTAAPIDHWTQGYRAAQDGATAWAFGCGEGMRARNSWAFRQIIKSIKES